MQNVANWFEIYTADFDRAKKIYTDVFNFTITDLPMSNENHSDMRYATFPGDKNQGRSGGVLVKINEVKPGAGGTLVDFSSGKSMMG